MGAGGGGCMMVRGAERTCKFLSVVTALLAFLLFTSSNACCEFAPQFRSV